MRRPNPSNPRKPLRQSSSQSSFLLATTLLYLGGNSAVDGFAPPRFASRSSSSSSNTRPTISTTSTTTTARHYQPPHSAWYDDPDRVSRHKYDDYSGNHGSGSRAESHTAQVVDDDDERCRHSRTANPNTYNTGPGSRSHSNPYHDGYDETDYHNNDHDHHDNATPLSTHLTHLHDSIALLQTDAPAAHAWSDNLALHLEGLRVQLELLTTHAVGQEAAWTAARSEVDQLEDRLEALRTTQDGAMDAELAALRTIHARTVATLEERGREMEDLQQRLTAQAVVLQWSERTAAQRQSGDVGYASHHNTQNLEQRLRDHDVLTTELAELQASHAQVLATLQEKSERIRILEQERSVQQPAPAAPAESRGRTEDGTSSGSGGASLPTRLKDFFRKQKKGASSTTTKPHRDPVSREPVAADPDATPWPTQDYHHQNTPPRRRVPTEEFISRSVEELLEENHPGVRHVHHVSAPDGPSSPSSYHPTEGLGTPDTHHHNRRSDDPLSYGGTPTDEYMSFPNDYVSPVCNSGWDVDPLTTAPAPNEAYAETDQTTTATDAAATTTTSTSTTAVVDDEMERLAADYLHDPDDPGRLSWPEVRASWGSWSNFMLSYGLEPYRAEDLDAALRISQARSGRVWNRGSGNVRP